MFVRSTHTKKSGHFHSASRLVQRYNRRLCCERLEDRRLLSTDSFAAVLNEGPAADSCETGWLQSDHNDAIRVIAGCQANETWLGTNCSVVADTTDFAYGRQSLRVAVNAGATGVVTYTLPEVSRTRGEIGILIRVDDLTKLDFVNVQVNNDAVNGYRYPIYQRATGEINGFNLVNDTWAICWVRRRQFLSGPSGSPIPWATGAANSVDDYPITNIRLEFVARSGQSPVIHIGGFFDQTFDKAGIIFQFDDSPATTFTEAYPIMESHGWKGSVAIASTFIGSDAHYAPMLSKAQVDALYAAGWETVSHSYAHLSHDTTMTLEAQDADLRLGQEYLRANGWNRGSQFFAWPSNLGTNVQNNSIPIVSKYYVAARAPSFRTEQWPLAVTETTSTWIPRDVYNLSYTALCTGTLETAKTIVSRAVHDGQLAIFFIHDVRPNATDWGITVDAFNDMVNYVQGFVDEGTAEVITMTDWWNRVYGNASLDTSVLGRYIVYNNSSWDGNDPSVAPSDNNAIAIDKQPLLPGEAASFRNYTNYTRGINGIAIDFDHLPANLTVDDFQFKVGNDNDPSAWATAPAAQISAPRQVMVNGFLRERVTITWPDGAIKNQWLQVTIRATENTGLAHDDVFYFGNAIGETGNLPSSAIVNSADEVGVRNNPHGPTNRAGIDDVYDFNRDGLVNSSDQMAVRNNGTTPSTALKLITAPVQVIAEAPAPSYEDLFAALAMLNATQNSSTALLEVPDTDPVQASSPIADGQAVEPAAAVSSETAQAESNTSDAPEPMATPADGNANATPTVNEEPPLTSALETDSTTSTPAAQSTDAAESHCTDEIEAVAANSAVEVSQADTDGPSFAAESLGADAAQPPQVDSEQAPPAETVVFAPTTTGADASLAGVILEVDRNAQTASEVAYRIDTSEAYRTDTTDANGIDATETRDADTAVAAFDAVVVELDEVRPYNWDVLPTVQIWPADAFASNTLADIHQDVDRTTAKPHVGKVAEPLPIQEPLLHQAAINSILGSRSWRDSLGYLVWLYDFEALVKHDREADEKPATRAAFASITRHRR